MNKHFIGIDIGSTSAKTIVLDENKGIVTRILLPTGWSSKETSEIILKKLNELNLYDGNSSIVATGYGRVSVSFANKAVTEITCHGKGASHLWEFRRGEHAPERLRRSVATKCDKVPLGREPDKSKYYKGKGEKLWQTDILCGKI